MTNSNIFNLFSFLKLFLGYFLGLGFRAIFIKFGLNTGFLKYSKEKVKKNKKKLHVIICHIHIQPFFGYFLPSLFTIYHLTNWLFLPEPQLGNLGKTRF